MAQLSQQIFVCVDCESTGLDPKRDSIIEVGAIRFTLEEELARYSSLVDPGLPIPPESQKIHRISDEMVTGQPKIATLLEPLLAFIGDAVLIGHNIGFDIALIANAAKKHGIQCHIDALRSIDTLRLARLYGESPTNSLEGLRKHFRIGQERPHRALDDAYVNMEVFKRLSQPYRTLRQLMEELDKPIRMRVMPLGKYKGRSFSEIPPRLPRVGRQARL